MRTDNLFSDLFENGSVVHKEMFIPVRIHGIVLSQAKQQDVPFKTNHGSRFVVSGMERNPIWGVVVYALFPPKCT